MATALGLTLLASSKQIGFDTNAALAGISSQLSTTGPAALLVLAIAVVELAAGLVLARATRRTPFTSIAHALLAASVALVLKDIAELGILGQLGLFRAPVLAVVDVGILGLGWRLRPLISTSWRPSLAALGSLPIAVLIGVIWIGPILLQLASPVVPFIDVLPNHVAPAEHLRTFGVFTPLTATQSPIYGPSRTLLGYTAVLGAVTTLVGLPATLVAAALVLPTTLLIGVAAYRLAVVAAGPAVGPWALLAFALTGSFARLADDRATVVVLPLVAWALAFVIERERASSEDRRAADAAWRWPPGLILGLALGAAILVHPIIGALAVGTVGVVALVRPSSLGALGVTAGLTAATLAIPQLTTMVGIALPTIAAVIAIPAAVLVGLVADRGSAAYPKMLRAARWLPLLLIPIAVIAAIAALPAIGDVVTAPLPFVGATALLIVAAILGFAGGVTAARSPVVLAAVGVGFAVALATQLVPGEGAGLLAQGIRFELPKTLYYWLPVALAVPAAATLEWLWRTERLAWLPRVGAVGLWVVVAALPLRTEPIDALHLGEHRFSEALAIDLRYAGSGFWTGYPDSREIVDASRRELIAAVRQEIGAGRIGPDTPILHVALSFQQWIATPLGVFTGVTETDATLETEVSIHTVGGRLVPLESLQPALDSRAYRYLLFEPNQRLPPGIGDAIAQAGYLAIFTNEQGTLFRLTGA
jgi:hypothetical protein